MDEPTAALSTREVDELYRIIGRLKAAGKAILFISHKLEEVFAVADRYTVFRDGARVGDGDIGGVDQDALVRMMVGRPITQVFPKREVAIGKAVLEVRGVGNDTEFEDISFSLRRGEVLGFYGLIGAGRTELMEALFGLGPIARGSVELEGRPAGGSPRRAIERGLVWCRRTAAQRRHPVPSSATTSRCRLCVRWRAGRSYAAAEAELAAASPGACRSSAPASSRAWPSCPAATSRRSSSASGWPPDPCLILDEPTKGSISDRRQRHEFIGELVEQGLSVILVSSELPELMDGRPHHRHVQGRIAGSWPAPSSTPARSSARPPGSASLPLARRRMRSLLRRREAALAIVVAVLVAAIAVRAPVFLSAGSLDTLVTDGAILAIMALAQMLALLTRGIDLSVAANMALSGMVVALLSRAHPDMPVVATIAVAAGSGLLLGAFNAVLIAFLEMPPIVVTLGTMSVYRGLVFWASDGAGERARVGEGFVAFPNERLFGLTHIVWIARSGSACSCSCCTACGRGGSSTPTAATRRRPLRRHRPARSSCLST